jgi:hypothetical protein
MSNRVQTTDHFAGGDGAGYTIGGGEHMIGGRAFDHAR